MNGRQLSFLSWNLAMLERSAEAPTGWSLEHTEDAVRQTVMDIDPDVIAFQELPRLVPYIPTHDMVRANPETHSGNLAVLIRRDLLGDAAPSFEVIPGCAICVRWSDQVTVANVHLMAGPGRDPAAMRLDQIGRIIDACSTPELLVIGDTNTRTDELEAIAAAGLLAGAMPTPTWDAIRNPFNEGGREFRAFFSRWLATGGVEVDDLDVLDEPWSHAGASFHLSDHFGFTGSASW